VLKIKFERLNEIPVLNPKQLVKVKEMGNIVEVQYMSKRNNKQTIQMLPGGDQFLICATGEVKDCVKGTTRLDNKKGLYKTFENARAIINANVTNVENVRWCTLTYAENMTDCKQLYEDFKKFNQRFQYYCKQHGYGNPEYIVMMEPQARGAWHCHLLYIWKSKAPFIPNEEFRNLWGHGFVKIKKLDNVDNVGAYLTAYLGDMEISEVDTSKMWDLPIVKEREVIENDKPIKKKFIKGARLDLYPANFNMLRYSRGCVKPTETFVPLDNARKKVSAATKTFESVVKLSDNDFECIIVKQYYNKLRK